MEEISTQITNKILEDLGLQGISGKTREALLEKIRIRVLQKTLLTIIQELPETSYAQLEEKISQRTKEEDIITEMAKQVPDLENKIINTIHSLYQELVNDAKRIVSQAS